MVFPCGECNAPSCEPAIVKNICSSEYVLGLNQCMLVFALGVGGSRVYPSVGATVVFRFNCITQGSLLIEFFNIF